MSKFPIGSRVLVKDEELALPWPGTVVRGSSLPNYVGVALDPGVTLVHPEDIGFVGDWLCHFDELEALDE